ncbi:hypothetical protein N431DRAFT_445717 [Stipitochalara longipes BDJ]|nr:hypothetical protein N431DRAFT_445717 [Stipitochalara longipes BDJ]
MAPSDKKTLREKALETNKTNPSQLGDPISLKSETSDNSPTNQDRGASSSSQSNNTKSNINNVAPSPTEGDGKQRGEGHKTLRQKAMDKLEENPSQLGDPVSLKAEKADSEPTENDRGAKGTAGKSKL